MDEAVPALETDCKGCFRLQLEFAVLLSWIWGGKKYNYSIRASDR
jgi:hypothetical protein